MKKLIIIALTLVGCSKDSEVKPDYPIKFQSTAYSNGYTMKTKQSPINLTWDFVALPSLAQGVDMDYYELKVGNEDLSIVYIKPSIGLKASDSRNVKNSIQVYSSWCNAAPTIYYQITRLDDGKQSEIRRLGTLWK